MTGYYQSFSQQSGQLKQVKINLFNFGTPNLVIMDFKFLYYRITNIILNPVKAWEAIYSENRPIKFVRSSFFLPLVILAAVSAFLGSFLFTHTGFSNAYPVLIGIKYFLLLFFVVYATSFIFQEILKALDLKGNFKLSFKIITYSVAPFLICQIISRLIESFIFVNVLALYGVYIYWTGIEKMINPPEHKKIPMAIATTVSFIALFVVTNWLLTLIIEKLYFTFFA